MTAAEILSAQLLDPFRIGLLIALCATMLRTQNATGTYIPLAAGAVFVAVIIPMTLTPPGAGGMVEAVAYGVVANVILLGIMLALLSAWRRFRA